MRYTPRTMLATVTAGAAVALGAGLFGAGAAYATYDDPRATPNDGNAVTCEDAGLEGVDVTGLLTVEGGVPDVDQYLTVTAVEAGTVVTGIVVKGGNGYNVYVPGEGLELLPPWEDLQSPLNGGHQVPQISHWYACGVTTEPTTPPTSEPETPPTSDVAVPPAETSAPVAPAPAPPAAAPELAATGFDSAQWVGFGGVLLAVGVALAALPRLRRRTQ